MTSRKIYFDTNEKWSFSEIRLETIHRFRTIFLVFWMVRFHHSSTELIDTNNIKSLQVTFHNSKFSAKFCEFLRKFLLFLFHFHSFYLLNEFFCDISPNFANFLIHPSESEFHPELSIALGRMCKICTKWMSFIQSIMNLVTYLLSFR